MASGSCSALAAGATYGDVPAAASTARSGSRAAGTWPLCLATASAAVSAFAAAILSGEDLVPPLSGQAWMVLLALGPQTLGWLLIARGVQRLRAFAVSLLLTIQPVLTTIWGAILAFGEHLRPLQAVGVALVLGGVLLARPLDARRIRLSKARCLAASSTRLATRHASASY